MFCRRRILRLAWGLRRQSFEGRQLRIDTLLEFDVDSPPAEADCVKRIDKIAWYTFETRGRQFRLKLTVERNQKLAFCLRLATNEPQRTAEPSKSLVEFHADLLDRSIPPTA